MALLPVTAGEDEELETTDSVNATFCVVVEGLSF
jgi:hypothetical protein